MALFVILTVGSGGILLLISYWKPHWRLRLTSVRCRLCDAEEVLVKVVEHIELSVTLVYIECVPEQGWWHLC